MTGIDEELFRRAATGDAEAFWRLVVPHRGLVYSVALGMMRDPERAEDAVHDVLVHAFRSLSNLRDPAKLPSWLYAMTRNRLMDQVRREQRLRRALSEPVSPLTTIVSVSELMEKERWLTHMERALGQLPEPFRIVLAMKYVNASSCREMAEVLDISVSAVKSRLFEARKLLRRLTEKAAAEEKKVRRHGLS